jgi:hypothetical protein
MKRLLNGVCGEDSTMRAYFTGISSVKHSPYRWKFLDIASYEKILNGLYAAWYIESHAAVPGAGTPPAAHGQQHYPGRLATWLQ